MGVTVSSLSSRETAGPHHPPRFFEFQPFTFLIGSLARTSIMVWNARDLARRRAYIAMKEASKASGELPRPTPRFRREKCSSSGRPFKQMPTIEPRRGAN